MAFVTRREPESERKIKGEKNQHTDLCQAWRYTKHHDTHVLKATLYSWYDITVCSTAAEENP